MDGLPECRVVVQIALVLPFTEGQPGTVSLIHLIPFHYFASNLLITTHSFALRALSISVEGT